MGKLMDNKVSLKWSFINNMFWLFVSTEHNTVIYVSGIDVKQFPPLPSVATQT